MYRARLAPLNHQTRHLSPGRLATPGLARSSAGHRGDDRNAGMRILGRDGKLRAFDIGEATWQDVDTPQALAYAESIFNQRFYQMPSAEGFASV